MTAPAVEAGSERPAPPPTCWELTLPVPAGASDGLTNFLWEQGALGVVEEEPPGAPARLRAFFPPAADGRALVARVEAYLASLAALGFSGGGPPRLAPVEERDWADAWRAHFRPLAVGRALIVAPPWETAGGDGRLVITIEPGRAFGTGHHGSTAGCLALLESIVEHERPARALDVGTGSGILAIAAARLGVGAVLAIDDDPDAVAAAAANAGRNGVADRVRCVRADAARLSAPPAPLVLANLLAAAHRSLAARYPRYVTGGGALVLGGLLDAEADDVAAALRRHGFRRRGGVSVDGWTSLHLGHASVHDHP